MDNKSCNTNRQDTNSNSSNQIYHIYDKMFKKILTLSSKAVINFINGLFQTEYPTDSTITYNWTEFHDDNLTRTIADTILTIGGIHSYHIEAQMYRDEDIVLRIFDYGYKHSLRNAKVEDNICYLTFPKSKIVFLGDDDVPDHYSIVINFADDTRHEYHVDTFKYCSTSIEELNQKKMVILIPFELIKLRKYISSRENMTEEDLNWLKERIFTDIIGCIRDNCRFGNITAGDAKRLEELLSTLYDHLYSNRQDMKEIREEMDQSIKLDVDEWADKMDKYEEMEREMNKYKSDCDKLKLDSDRYKSDNDKLKSENEKMAKLIEELTAKLEAKLN